MRLTFSNVMMNYCSVRNSRCVDRVEQNTRDFRSAGGGYIYAIGRLGVGLDNIDQQAAEIMTLTPVDRSRRICHECHASFAASNDN